MKKPSVSVFSILVLAYVFPLKIKFTCYQRCEQQFQEEIIWLLWLGTAVLLCLVTSGYEARSTSEKGNCKNPQGPTCVAWVVIIRKQGLFWAGYKPPLVCYKCQFKCYSAKESCWSAYVSFSYLCLLVQYTSLSSIRWAPSMVFIELPSPMCVAQ